MAKPKSDTLLGVSQGGQEAALRQVDHQGHGDGRQQGGREHGPGLVVGVVVELEAKQHGVIHHGWGQTEGEEK